MDDCSAKTPRRPPVASTIRDRMANLADTAAEIDKKLHEKLEQIMTAPRPAINTTLEDCKEIMEYPPLFEQMRKYLESAENSLISIDNALERTEL